MLRDYCLGLVAIIAVPAFAALPVALWYLDVLQ
jgi:hypothetical protein